MFAFGFVVGKRTQRLATICTPADPIAQIEADQDHHDELMFYRSLTEKRAGDLSPSGLAPKKVFKPVAVAESHHVDAGEADTETSMSPSPKVAAASETSRADLDKALARLRRDEEISQTSQIKGDLNAGPAQSGEYTVQVSAFQSEAEAKAYAAGLERKGFKPFVVSSAIADRGRWFRVRLGRFAAQADAQVAKKMLAQAAIPGWVLRAE
ncbi:MAG: SPOR domain-containing protein [Myxococcota bacterium]